MTDDVTAQLVVSVSHASKQCHAVNTHPPYCYSTYVHCSAFNYSFIHTYLIQHHLINKTIQLVAMTLHRWEKSY